MKSIPLTGVVLVLLSAHFCKAEDPEKFYYLGEAKLSSPTGEPRDFQAFLIEKVHDPDYHLIIERAIVMKADNTVEQYTMNITVHDNTFALKDAANTITGTGTLFGPAWQWTYFRATYQASNDVKIEDENFMADPSACIARKKIIGPDGKAIACMDITLKAITPTTFDLLAAALLKK